MGCNSKCGCVASLHVRSGLVKLVYLRHSCVWLVAIRQRLFGKGSLTSGDVGTDMLDVFMSVIVKFTTATCAAPMSDCFKFGWSLLPSVSQGKEG